METQIVDVVAMVEQVDLKEIYDRFLHSNR